MAKTFYKNFIPKLGLWILRFMISDLGFGIWDLRFGI
jgi:hypothetical protein